MPSLVIGTAGHVDHGKSALVRALTGVDVDAAPGGDDARVTVDRGRIDRLKDEQRRGITIDLGFAHMRAGDVEIAFVDVPGHERFVRNMLAGAGGFDAVLLVVAADESVKPQTVEHAAICRLLGLERGVIALTKADLVDAETQAIVTLEIQDLVAGTFLAGAPIVPVSVKTREGLEALRAALAALATGGGPPSERSMARLPIDRAFTAKGFGTVVTGTLVSGAMAEGDELQLLPDGRRVRVRGVHVHNRPVARAEAPRRVAVNLGHVATSDVGRGATLAAAGTLAVTRRLDVRLDWLAAAPPLRHGGRVRLHLGTTDVGARVAIGATRARDAAPDHWRAAAIGEGAVVIPPGGAAFARLRLDQPVAATRGDRLVVRGGSPVTTLGGGVVIDPEPEPRGLRRAAALARFLALDFRMIPGIRFPESSQGEPALVFLTDAGARGLSTDDLIRRAGLGHAAAESVLARLVDDGRAIRGADRVYDAAAAAAAEARVLGWLEAARRQGTGSDEPGVARETLRERLARGATSAWFDLIVGGLIARGTIIGTDRLVLAGQSAGPAPADARARELVENVLRKAGLMPPAASALVSATSLAPGDVDRVLRALVKDKRAVRLGDLTFHAEALAALKAGIGARAAAARAAGQPARIDVADFKREHGLSRKFAIPLLEWLDRERVTRRAGEQRIVI